MFRAGLEPTTSRGLPLDQTFQNVRVIGSLLTANTAWNAGQDRDRSSENEAQLKYLGTTVTNKDIIQEEIKERLNSGDACYHSVENLL
jgi:hypothetical protein